MKPKVYDYQNLAQNLPAEVKKIFTIFSDEIRLVGGCVRDLLCGEKLHDFDFATPFLPEKIIEILQKNNLKAIPTGERFGTITAVVNGKNFEITTLRKDLETDGRHCKPEFVDDYFFDAARRDFTINALYLDSAGVLYDYFDGISDLEKKCVKFIGEPQQRIEEDYLRILRFFRFTCKYALRVDLEGLEACLAQKENLQKLSRERVRFELLKILNSPQKSRNIVILKILKKQKIAHQIFSQDFDLKALIKIYKIEKRCLFEISSAIKLVSLFWREGFDQKDFFAEICATNIEKKYFLEVEKYYQRLHFKCLRQELAFLEKGRVIDFYLIALAKNSPKIDFNSVQKNLHYLKNISLPKFPLKGDDLILLGLLQKQVGEAINLAKIFWADSDFLASKNELINFLKSEQKIFAKANS